MSRFRPLGPFPWAFAGVLASLLAHAQVGGDLQAQILYAFHAEDPNLLSGVVQTLSTQEEGGAADDALRYHLAHAQYRLGLLEARKHSRSAASRFEGCIGQLKPVLESGAGSADAQAAQSSASESQETAETRARTETLALQSACYANLARLEKFEAVLLRSRAADRLNSAFKLAPRNPRVLYLEAVEGLARSVPGSDESQKAFAQLELAAHRFEETSATGADAPGWGHAEAYLELGRQLQSRGDFLGARNWIEKSLIVAPDFKAAQRQLAALSSALSAVRRSAAADP